MVNRARLRVGNIFCRPFVRNLLPAFNFTARRSSNISSLCVLHITRQQRWPPTSNEVQVQQLYLPLKFDLPPSLFPFAYPSLARQRKFSWLSTPKRARHWLATFLGQGCCAACCCKAKKPKLHEPQLGSANWRTESCWMLDATAVAAAAAGCVLSLVLNAVPGAGILSYARFISSNSIGISVHTV